MKWTADCVDPSLDDIMDGFFGCLVGCTFQPEDVVVAMKMWSEAKYKAMNLED